jgi:hypothetical protein
MLLDLLVICDLLVTHHPPDQASYGRSRSDPPGPDLVFVITFHTKNYPQDPKMV